MENVSVVSSASPNGSPEVKILNSLTLDKPCCELPYPT